MPSSAVSVFDAHMRECREAVAVYAHLATAAGFRADFNLRFVWIASVSALDHYVSQLILERATVAFADGKPLQPKLLSEVMTFQNAISFRGVDVISAVLQFRKILDAAIRYRSFQSPDSIADGLSFIWPEKKKWGVLGAILNMKPESARRKLSAIVDRRNLIAHNGDFDEGLGLCCTNPVRDSPCESSVVAVVHEQT